MVVRTRNICYPVVDSYVGDNAFDGCTSLQGIYFGDNNTTTTRSIDADRNSTSDDAYEIARYNLSGRPCSPNDKGVQIIVYSDYTTRTTMIN